MWRIEMGEETETSERRSCGVVTMRGGGSPDLPRELQRSRRGMEPLVAPVNSIGNYQGRSSSCTCCQALPEVQYVQYSQYSQYSTVIRLHTALGSSANVPTRLPSGQTIAIVLVIASPHRWKSNVSGIGVLVLVLVLPPPL